MKHPKFFPRLIISITSLLIITIFIAPLIIIFIEALKNGSSTITKTIFSQEFLDSLKLSLIVVAIVVPLNTLFGIMASWCLTKFEFFGKTLILTIIDIPIAISPVISGYIYILLYNEQSVIGKWLMKHNIDIVFALPGMIMVTIFVTLPYIARELIPIMRMIGTEEEESSVMLGVKNLKTIMYITLPNIKWSLISGILITAARSISEYGAVSVISGNIKGVTSTLPIYVDILYHQYDMASTFVVASFLCCISISTIFVKIILSKQKNH